MTKTIEEKLLKLPGEIRDQQNMMLETAAKLADKQKEVHIKELSVSDFILNNEDAKKKYTNDKARKAAVDVQLALDADYIKISKELATLEQTVSLERIGLEFLHNTLRAAIAIAGMSQTIYKD